HGRGRMPENDQIDQRDDESPVKVNQGSVVGFFHRGGHEALEGKNQESCQRLMCLAVSAPRDDKLREKLALPAMNRGEAAIPGALNLRRRRECVARRPRCAMQILTDRRTRRACQYLPDETFAPLAPSQEPKRTTDVEPD